MSRFKIINLIDKLFVSICIFLVVYAWINFYIRSLWTTFFLSLIFSFAIIFVLYYFLDKKQEKTKKSKQRTNEINKYHLAFRLMPRNEKKALIKHILSKQFGIQINDDLSYEKDGKKSIILISTESEILSQNDLINLIESAYNEDLDSYIIICNSHMGLKTKILKNKTITLIDKDNLFDMFQATEIYPDISNLDDSVIKFSWKDFFLNMFQKQKAKSYFFAGFILIFSSIILPYHIYYLLFGSTLLIFALLCKLLPKLKNIRDKS